MRSASAQHLFAGSRLSEALAAAARNATDKLATWPPDDLLNTAEADVTEQLVSLATIEMPSLARSEARLEPPREVSVESRDFGRQFNVTVTRFTLVVPVTGASSAFGMTASRMAGSMIQGRSTFRGRSAAPVRQPGQRRPGQGRTSADARPDRSATGMDTSRHPAA